MSESAASNLNIISEENDRDHEEGEIDDEDCDSDQINQESIDFTPVETNEASVNHQRNLNNESRKRKSKSKHGRLSKSSKKEASERLQGSEHKNKIQNKKKTKIKKSKKKENSNEEFSPYQMADNSLSPVTVGRKSSNFKFGNIEPDDYHSDNYDDEDEEENEIDPLVALDETKGIFRSRDHPREVELREKRRRERRVKKSREFLSRKQDRARSSQKNTEVCRYFREGRCDRADACNFSHDVGVIRKMELCKFYSTGNCNKGENCIFLHSQFPCKYFHKSTCREGDGCKFSHDQLTEETSKMLERAISESTQVHENYQDRSVYAPTNENQQHYLFTKIVMPNPVSDFDSKPKFNGQEVNQYKESESNLEHTPPYNDEESESTILQNNQNNSQFNLKNNDFSNHNLGNMSDFPPQVNLRFPPSFPMFGPPVRAIRFNVNYRMPMQNIRMQSKFPLRIPPYDDQPGFRPLNLPGGRGIPLNRINMMNPLHPPRCSRFQSPPIMPRFNNVPMEMINNPNSEFAFRPPPVPQLPINDGSNIDNLAMIITREIIKQNYNSNESLHNSEPITDNQDKDERLLNFNSSPSTYVPVNMMSHMDDYENTEMNTEIEPEIPSSVSPTNPSSPEEKPVDFQKTTNIKPDSEPVPVQPQYSDLKPKINIELKKIAWELIPLKFPGKLPYPLMNLDCNIPNFSKDPRLTGSLNNKLLKQASSSNLTSRAQSLLLDLPDLQLEASDILTLKDNYLSNHDLNFKLTDPRRVPKSSDEALPLVTNSLDESLESKVDSSSFFNESIESSDNSKSIPSFPHFGQKRIRLTLNENSAALFQKQSITKEVVSSQISTEENSDAFNFMNISNVGNNINEKSNCNIASFSASINSDRSYLMDPRFKIKKLSSNATCSQQETTIQEALESS